MLAKLKEHHANFKNHLTINLIDDEDTLNTEQATLDDLVELTVRIMTLAEILQVLLLQVKLLHASFWNENVTAVSQRQLPVWHH